LVIVFADTTEDVVNAITWARQNDVALRARSGRHSLEGWSNVSGETVINVSEMKSARLDPASRTVTVGVGFTQSEIVTTLGEEGFAVATGGEATVGLAGATLGGGLGFLTRNFGMACDNLMAAEVVVPSGDDGAKAITADEHNYSDLLWALRSAGNGNFGIVTSFTYRMHPLKQLSLLEAQWNGFEDLRGVFDAWQRQAPTTDLRLSSVLDIGPDAIGLLAVLQSGSPTEAKDLLAPVLSVGKPDVSVQAGIWADTFARLQPPSKSAVEKTKNWKFFSQFVTEPYPRRRSTS
jgi:FAD/FMN-containing dehydrogenase